MENQLVKPDYLLFEKAFEGKPLFPSRQALISDLIANTQSYYYVDAKNNQEEYLKTVNKLKSFLSQVLNGANKRIINTEFKDSLYQVLLAKSFPPDILENYFQNLLESFARIKKNVPVKKPSPTFDEELDMLVSDFDEAGYVVFISVRPYELENEPNEYLRELRDKTIAALAANLHSPSLKKFRYNIPSREVGTILWRRLHLLLCRYFLHRDDLDQILLMLKEKFEEIEISDHESDEIAIRKLVSQFLLNLNAEGTIWVFINTLPIYVCSQIHFNPNQLANSSNFIYFNASKDTLDIYKYDKTESIYWQEQVWYRMKEMLHSKSLLYNNDFSKSLDEPL